MNEILADPIFWFLNGMLVMMGVLVFVFVFSRRTKGNKHSVRLDEKGLIPLEGNKEFVMTILNSLADIVIVARESGDITFVSEAWHKFTGTRTDEAVSRSLPDLFQEEEKVLSGMEKAIQGDGFIHRETVHLKLGRGRYRLVRLSLKIWQDKMTGASRLIGSIRDIEKQENAIKGLEKAEERYRNIVENSLEGIYQSSPAGRFIRVNPMMAEILGYDSPDEMIHSIGDIRKDFYVNPDVRAEFLTIIDETLGAKGLDAQVWRKGGSKIWVRETCRPVLDENGTILYYEGTMSNITDQKQAAEDLRIAQERSDAASRVKSEFLANMSHELRTPLNSIIGFSEILKDEIFGALGKPEYKEYSEDIHIAGMHLLNVINDILDVSKIEAGKRELYEEIVCFPDVVQASLVMIRAKAHEALIKINVDVPEDLPNIRAEELALKQILINLLSNAVKFTEAKGSITLKAFINDRGQFEVFVEDSGIGMQESDIDKALSAFGQIDSSLNKKVSGTGLGLTLVKQLVELHGGRLNVRSAPGQGTKVTFVFSTDRVVNEAKSLNGDTGGAKNN